MLCARCRIPIIDGKCPNCGAEAQSSAIERETESPEADSSSIKFEIVSVSRNTESKKEEEPLDWRSELKRKLSEHSSRRQEEEKSSDSPSMEESDDPDTTLETPLAQARESVDQTGKSEADSKVDEKSVETEADRKREESSEHLNGQESEEKLQADHPESKKQMEIIDETSSSGPDAQLVSDAVEESKTAEETDLKSETAENVPASEDKTPNAENLNDEARPVKKIPQQRKLTLEGRASKGNSIYVRKKRRARKSSKVSNEILLSRLLAGIIDLTVPLLVGLGFVATASWKIDFDPFGYDALIWITAFAGFFFIFNSLFFLLVSGQTPGMFLTDLKIVSSDPDEDVSAGVLILRVVFYVLTVISVVGLLWSLIDPRKRCFHDILSGTRVVPLDLIQ